MELKCSFRPYLGHFSGTKAKMLQQATDDVEEDILQVGDGTVAGCSKESTRQYTSINKHFLYANQDNLN